MEISWRQVWESIKFYKDARKEEAAIIGAMIKNKKKDFEMALNNLQEVMAINFKIR